MKYAKLIDEGEVFPWYKEWASVHKLKNWKEYLSVEGDILSNKIGQSFAVIAEGPHLGTFREYLYAIRDEEGNEFIISSKGVELLDIDSNKNFLLGL